MNLNFSKIASISSLVTFASSFVMFLIGVILAKTLTPDIFGQYSIFRSLIIFLPLMLYMGLGNSLIRMQKKIDVFNGRWKEVFNLSFTYSFFISLPLCLIFYFLYDFKLLNCVIIFLSCIFIGRAVLANSIMRLYEMYILGLLVVNIWRFIYLVVLLLFIGIGLQINLDILLLIIFFSSLVGYFVSTYFETTIPSGKENISYHVVFTQGFMFFLFGISNIFLAQLDKLFIGFHYGFTHVGAYTAISLFPITVFNLVASSIGVIAMPYLIRNNTKEVISKKALAISFFFIPIPIFFFFHIFGITILEFVFSNKFSTDYWYFIYCNLLGLIQYLQVLSYYILGALKDNSEVRKITLLNYLVISLLVPLYLILSFYFSLLGSIISFILVWIGRLFISLYYIFNKKDKVDFV